MILPALIVALSALLAVTVVRHPWAALIAIRGKVSNEDTKDDVGSRGKITKALLIGVAISIGMGGILGLIVLAMETEWLIRLAEWLASVISPVLIVVLYIVVSVVGLTLNFLGCFSWLTKRRFALIVIAQLLLIGLWVAFDSWLIQDMLVAMIAVIFILQVQIRASFLRLSLILVVAAFLYDAWQVFGTGNMSEYADAVMPIQETASQERVYGFPALLIIPESFAWHAKWVGMLGLGDLAVGGIMAVTALRVGRRIGTNAPFYAVIVAYAASLFCADFVLRQFNVGQPATIYIVPLCMGVVMLWALLSGQWVELKKPVFGKELYAPD